MNARFMPVAVVLFVVLAGLLLMAETPRLDAAPMKPQRPAVQTFIKASHLQRGEIVVDGLLGKPLGTRVVVSGQRYELGKVVYPISVDHVDGRRLASAVRLEMPNGPTLRTGVRYTLEGYESGAFIGEPMWSKPGVQSPFQYRPHFVVTRVVEGPSR
jgi:hypothetical protein